MQNANMYVHVYVNRLVCVIYLCEQDFVFKRKSNNGKNYMHINKVLMHYN